MPEPREQEREDDFLRRCMTDPEANADFPDPAQRYAFCQSQWENRAVDTTTKSLLATIAQRKQGGTFGGGITTADRYVRHVLDTQVLAASGEQGLHDVDAVLKRASQTLTFCDPESHVEQVKRVATDAESLLPKGIKAPENTLLLVQHVVTTPREDRDTDILVTEGAELDPKAPLLWQHMHQFPMGRVLAIVDHTKKVLRVVSALLDINELTRDAAKLIEADVLRFSHGFRALEWEERKDDQGNPIYGFKVNRFEIMEVSLVSVPSNTDAEIELYAAGKLASPEFKAHAKSLYDQRRPIVPGATLPPTKTLEQPPAKSQKPESDAGPEGSQDPAPAEKQPAPEPPEEPASDKRGRVLSQRNQDALQEAIDDLQEVAKGDLTRAQKALIDKAVNRLKTVLKEAQADDDEEREAEPQPKAAETSVEDAIAIVLRGGSPEQHDRLADTLIAYRRVREEDVKAADYRRVVGIS